MNDRASRGRFRVMEQIVLDRARGCRRVLDIEMRARILHHRVAGDGGDRDRYQSTREEPFPFDAAYGRSLKAELSFGTVTVASIDDLIALKQRAGRPKDLEDSELDRAFGMPVPLLAPFAYVL